MTAEAFGGESVFGARGARLLFVLILVLRVGIAAQFTGNFDTESYLIVADAVLAGQNVYQATDRYNYSPVWSFVVAGLWASARPNVRLFILSVGLLQTTFDALTAWLLYRFARRRLAFGAENARRAALLFFANPVSVAVSCGHGQFDGIAVFFLLAAVSLLAEPLAPRRRPAAVGLLAASLLVKHVAAFHPLLFWRRLRKPGLTIWEIGSAYVLFGLSFLPFLPVFGRIWENVVLYPTMLKGPRGPFPGGLRAFFHFASGSAAGFSVIALAAFGWVIWATRRAALWKASLVLFLAVLVFLPSYSIQYLVWPVALGSLEAGPAYAIFSGLAALTSRSLHLRWPVIFDPLSAWAAALVWLALELRALRGRPALEVY